MRAMYGLYEDGRSAQRAVVGLRGAGIADDDITVISAEPLEDYEFSEIGKETWLWYIASGGGLVGLLFSTWLTRFTELAWPLPTGNMPIVAWWPNLIIMFELTMLGAIVATVVALAISCGLFRRRPVLYDPEVSDGKILVGVENPPDAAVPGLERALTAGPGVRLKTI